jgi:hypothetical protein
MGMLSVCYVKVRAMLNQGKTEMLNLGYGNVRARLRQKCSLTYASACKQQVAHRPGFTYMGAESWELGAEAGITKLC